MMRNNKGVTLVELLIVIVVMGIIAAFAIPAVGNIIENSEKDKVVSDALALEQGADYYCLEESCVGSDTAGAGTEITWAQILAYVDGVSAADYEFDKTGSADGTGDAIVAKLKADGTWDIAMPSTGTAGDYYWEATSGAPTDYASAKLKRAQVKTQS